MYSSTRGDASLTKEHAKTYLYIFSTKYFSFYCIMHFIRKCLTVSFIFFFQIFKIKKTENCYSRTSKGKLFHNGYVFDQVYKYMYSALHSATLHTYFIPNNKKTFGFFFYFQLSGTENIRKQQDKLKSNYLAILYGLKLITWAGNLCCQCGAYQLVTSL